MLHILKAKEKKVMNYTFLFIKLCKAVKNQLLNIFLKKRQHKIICSMSEGT